MSVVLRSIPSPHLRRLISLGVALWAGGVVMAAETVSPASPREWTTHGFAAFRQGTFGDGGTNLYVSAKGRVQTIHRFDLNGDGYFDLPFADSHDWNYMTPARAYRFSPRSREPQSHFDLPGAGSVRVLATDLNGDGYPDIVVARGFDNTTRVMNSAIYWGGPMGWNDRFHTELFTPFVRDVCAADLNHDGFSDLVFICSSSTGAKTSFIYWGGKDGFSYRRHVEFATPGATAGAVADLDHDGRMDLVVTASGGNETHVFWGVDDAPDDSRATALPTGEANAVAIADGRLFVSVQQGIQIYTVQRRTFHLEQRLPYADAGRVAIGDLNGDGIADLVVTHAPIAGRYESSSRIFWGQREQPFDNSHATDLPTLEAVDVAIADVDADGNPDLVFANSQSQDAYDVGSYVYWGGESGFDRRRCTEVPTRGALGVAAAGGTVAFANSISGRPRGDVDSYVYLGTPEGRYSDEHRLQVPTTAAYEALVSDLNDDGFNDLVITNSYEGDKLRDSKGGHGFGSDVFWGSGDGISPSRATELPTPGALGCAAADINRDGYLDLVFCNYLRREVQILYGGPSGYSEAHQQTWPVAEGFFPTIADLNGDGWLDLIVPSAPEGLWIYWGSKAGFDPKRSILLDGVGPVSVQVADLNRDGFLDLVAFNLTDFSTGRYRGVNTQIYWGSKDGYSSFHRSELPSLGAHYGVIQDFNRDGYLDIFVSNYQTEYDRRLDSYLYWGSPSADYSPAHRLALHNESAAGAMAADLNGDGWVDLVVANHVQNGDHLTSSRIFWNERGSFGQSNMTLLPTVGAHMMTGVDVGNIADRSLDETYTSVAYDAGAAMAVTSLSWNGETAFGSRVTFDLRSADSPTELQQSVWRPLDNDSSGERRAVVPFRGAAQFWQYRVHFHGGRGGAAWPVLTNVEVEFAPHH